VLCLHRLRQPIEPSTTHSPAHVVTEFRRMRLKVGPLWKLMHVVEPPPAAINTLELRDEKDELFVLDGPFAETKS
jgi:hypothetical protein